ncbi:DUF930 domain-containing protein [Celeribacter sp.]|uniref:DUF930 domain-containing protein n=1 Tax=Alphaproteobacteria TaxID=28211 RepID=UPI003A8F4453
MTFSSTDDRLPFRMRSGFAISALLHAVLLSALTLAVPRDAPRPSLETIPVELLALPARTGSRRQQAGTDNTPVEAPHSPPFTTAPAGETARRVTPSAAPEAPILRDKAPARERAKDSARLRPDPPRRDRPTPMVRAEKVYSTAAMDSPLGRQTREDLKGFDPQERLVQLCNYEAVEQVRHARPKLHADFVNAYARADLRFDGATLSAQGAAIHGGADWYALAFVCEAAAGLERVTGFTYSLGEKIARRDLERFGLPDGDVHPD